MKQPVIHIKKVYDALRCSRCGHEWIPRRATPPPTCPKCKSAYWDKPRRPPKKKKI